MAPDPAAPQRQCGSPARGCHEGPSSRPGRRRAAARHPARPGAFDDRIVRVQYVRQLRERWHCDPGTFLTLIERASGGQALTLTDDSGDEEDALRHILAAALKQSAATRRAEAERKARRPAQQTPPRAPPAAW
jgi:hypothetical protein